MLELTLDHSIINGHKESKMVSNSLKKYKKYHESKKNGDSMFCNGVTRENARTARMHVRVGDFL